MFSLNVFPNYVQPRRHQLASRMPSQKDGYVSRWGLAV
jgi:hypothetical protein